MSTTELGDTLDMHLGGEDLVFPHHENEIAQSECATGLPFVRYWMHVRHLFVEGKKMSKSLGNFITVRELLEEGYDPASIRHQLISSHYRGELNFTRDGLKASAAAVQRILDFEARLDAAVVDDAAEASKLPDDDMAAYVEQKIQERADARANKDFATSDAIRDELAEKDIVLEDGADGTRWKVVG